MQQPVGLQRDPGSAATLLGAFSIVAEISAEVRLQVATIDHPATPTRFRFAQSVLAGLCEAAWSVHARLSRRRLRWHSNAHFRPPRQSVVLSGIAKGRTHPPRASGFSYHVRDFSNLQSADPSNENASGPFEADASCRVCPSILIVRFPRTADLFDALFSAVHLLCVGATCHVSRRRVPESERRGTNRSGTA
jgi:hypothetical protein